MTPEQQPTPPRQQRRNWHGLVRCAAILGLVPLAALADASPTNMLPAALPDTAAHAHDTATTTSPAPTSSAFEIRTAPAAFTSATPTTDLPGPALAAYQRAEAVINASSRSCHLPWQLLAAVGQVESDHGRRTPPQTTPQPDTDAGLYDGTAAHDVPVGPLQITPQAWAAVGVDANGDSSRDANNLDDAALGLAVLLCGTGEDLSAAAGQQVALAQHNADPGYADAVITLASAYALPAALSARMVTPVMTAPALPKEQKVAARKAHAKTKTRPANAGAVPPKATPTPMEEPPATDEADAAPGANPSTEPSTGATPPTGDHTGPGEATPPGDQPGPATPPAEPGDDEPTDTCEAETPLEGAEGEESPSGAPVEEPTETAAATEEPGTPGPSDEPVCDTEDGDEAKAENKKPSATPGRAKGRADKML